MSSSTPLLGAQSFNSMSSRAKVFLMEGGHRSPGSKNSNNIKAKRNRGGGGRRRPLGFLSSPFQAHKKPSHVTLCEDDTVDQMKNDIASLQNQLRHLNETYRTNSAATDPRRCNDGSDQDSICSSDDQDDRYYTSKDHDQQLRELTRKLLHIQAGLVEIESERCQLIAKGKQFEQHVEILEDRLTSKDTQIQMLQKENQQLRQQSLRQQESKPFEVQQMKSKYESLSQNFVKVCEKLQKASKRTANIEFEKNALIALNQALQAKIQRVESRCGKEQENMKEILKHNANQLADLEDLLKEKSKLIDKLGDQLSAKDSNTAATLQSATTYFERKQQLARKQHDADVQALKHSHEQKVKCLQLKLQEKSSEYEALRAEFDSQMQRLMAATAEIERFSDERAAIESLMARLNSLDRECADYKEILFAKDTKIALLRADNMKKDLEMKYSTPSVESRQSSPMRLTTSEHPISHVVTPHRSMENDAMRPCSTDASSESPIVREVLSENIMSTDRLRHSKQIETINVSPDLKYSNQNAITASTFDDSLDWGIEESRISNSTAHS